MTTREKKIGLGQWREIIANGKKLYWKVQPQLTSAWILKYHLSHKTQLQSTDAAIF